MNDTENNVLSSACNQDPPEPFFVARISRGDSLDRAERAITWWQSKRSQPNSAGGSASAVEELELTIAALAGHRWAFAVPSGTLAIKAALSSLAVCSGDTVLMAARDWPAAWASAKDLGALPVKVSLGASDLPSLEDFLQHLTSEPRPRAVVLTHQQSDALFHASRARLVDAAKSYGVAVLDDVTNTILDGPLTQIGSVSCVSIGSGKPIDGIEGGLLCTSDVSLRRLIIEHLHPLRQHLLGSEPVYGLALRMHPIAAVMALHALETDHASHSH
jgi:8-amino-3,8-dideoxy-alpha-D-manno-octulosonate transaminase